jgi:hypothetical protein
MNTMVKNKIIISIILTFFSLITKSQTIELPDISADRPGIGTPPFITEHQCFQIETGISYEKNRLEKPFQENILYNSTLLRYGINKNSEIRFQTNYAQIKTDSLNITGFNPLTIGTKLLISDENGILPKTSFLFNLTLPYFGEKNFRPKNITPSFYLLMQNDISKKMNVCYNIGLEYDGESSIPTEFTVICIVYNITDKLSWFIENYNWFSDITKPVYFIDYGCAYLFGKDFQLDLSGNMNLRDLKKYFMLNFGVSWRINKWGEKKF